MFTHPVLRAIGAIALAAAAVPVVAQQRSVTVVSWGGNYTKNQTAAFYHPFSQASGVQVKSDDWNGEMGKVRAMVDAKAPTWDVIVGNAHYAKNGCEEGILEPINHADLGKNPDGTPVAHDFLPNTLMKCAVASIVFGNAMGYDARKFPSGGPQSARDFYDVAKFPGKRGLRRDPQTNLEIALMADGVALGDVYKVLSTPQGVERAFRKLDTLKGNVVWFDTFAQGTQLLNDGEVALTILPTARMVQPIVEQNKPWKVIMKDFMWDIDVWMVVKGSPNVKEAIQFIAFASRADRMADLASRSGYSPARKTALNLVGKNPVSGEDMKPYMITQPQVLSQGLQRSTEFWADHLDSLKSRFTSWLAK
jgi:putative spermidine/putrescine transport system substrate-binding protein